MTEQEINVAIAEFCGVTQFVGLMRRGYWYRPNAKGYTANVNEAGRYTRKEAKEHENLRDDQPVTIHDFPIPNYCADLNAVHGAEKKLIAEDYQLRNKYAAYVEGVLEAELLKDDPDCVPDVIGFEWIHATAKQRCEALLRTIGKWRE